MTDRLQSIFDKTLNHLRLQGQASVAVDEVTGEIIPRVCLYRGPSGRMCAAGCHIDDKDYRTEMETVTFSRVNFTYALDFSVLETELLSKMQVAHDMGLANYGMTTWEKNMKNIAKEFHLLYKC